MGFVVTTVVEVEVLEKMGTNREVRRSDGSSLSVHSRHIIRSNLKS